MCEEDVYPLDYYPPLGRSYKPSCNTMSFDEAARLAAQAGLPEDRLISVTEYGDNQLIVEMIVDLREPILPRQRKN